MWLTTNAITPNFTTCERRWICDSILIYVKKFMWTYTAEQPHFTEWRKTGILKCDSSHLIYLATLGQEELPSGNGCWLQNEFMVTITDGSVWPLNPSWTASSCVCTESSTTESQSELRVTAVSVIIKSIWCWVQAVYYSSLCGRLIPQFLRCFYLLSRCLPLNQPFKISGRMCDMIITGSVGTV